MTLDLDALEKLCDRATPGPWYQDTEKDCWGIRADSKNLEDLTINICEFCEPITENSDINAELICESRTALPELIKRVRFLEAQIQQDGIMIEGLISDLNRGRER